eukprot:gene12832-14150_t
MSEGTGDVEGNGVQGSSTNFQEHDEAQPVNIQPHESNEKKHDQQNDGFGIEGFHGSEEEKGKAATSDVDMNNEVQDGAQEQSEENKLQNEAVQQITITSMGATPVSLSNLHQVSQITSEQAEVTQITGLPPGVSLIQADQGQEGEGAIFLLVTGPVDGEGGTANAIAVDAATAAAMASLQNPLEAVSGGHPISIEELATVVSSSADQRVAVSTDDAAVMQVAATAEAQAAATSKAYASPSDVSLAQDILALASSALSTSEAKNSDTTSTSDQQGAKNGQSEDQQAKTGQEDDGKPNWACLLHDFQKLGDSYYGYVINEVEMDQVLNSYKKETNSLFAIRQTPSPVKEENGTVRLMWKSQHVPYDGVPFINIGRRATVMECEHGPRKKTNALKRMFNSSPVDKASLKSIVNLTCPARVFIKKVRKFPEFKVTSTTDPKILRTHQEQSLKQLRDLGMNTWTGGEVRLYMQLPDSAAHRYHMMPAITPNQLETTVQAGDYKTDIDLRVVTKIKETVRQGVHSPFVVRQIARHFVDKEMSTTTGEKIPKHDKSFYPSMIEIQNLTQQIQADVMTGVLTSLPAPADGFPQSKPKKRRSSMKGFGEPNSKKQAGSSENGDSKAGIGEGDADQGADGQTIGTFSLTLPEGQLENFSISNLNMEQLQQLAKIGLLALNNATTGKSSNIPTATATVTESGMIEIEAAGSQAESTSSTVETTQQLPSEAVVLLTTPSVNEQVTSSEAEEAVQAIEAGGGMTTTTTALQNASAANEGTAEIDKLPSMATVVAAGAVNNGNADDEAQPSTTTTNDDATANDESVVSSAEATTTTDIALMEANES